MMADLEVTLITLTSLGAAVGTTYVNRNRSMIEQRFISMSGYDMRKNDFF